MNSFISLFISIATTTTTTKTCILQNISLPLVLSLSCPMAWAAGKRTVVLLDKCRLNIDLQLHHLTIVTLHHFALE